MMTSKDYEHRSWPIAKLWKMGYKRLACWKACPHRHDNPIAFNPIPAGTLIKINPKFLT